MIKMHARTITDAKDSRESRVLRICLPSNPSAFSRGVTCAQKRKQMSIDTSSINLDAQFSVCNATDVPPFVFIEKVQVCPAGFRISELHDAWPYFEETACQDKEGLLRKKSVVTLKM